MPQPPSDTHIVCPRCAISIDAAQLSTANGDCPNCGEAIGAPAPIPWTDVARIANLAEAGFLTDELIGHGIDARVQQLDDFNALYHRWTTVYLIRVPSDFAVTAAELIRPFVDEDIREQQASGVAPSLSDRLADPVLWRAVAVIA
ncbi:MAG TPA: hypothetical protein VFW73_11470, partial [Lacipirellulaceae bacterium]|nr:hypothetical protein [Lacipirellulaceae bacterium]